jgi:hypothetical protein
MLINYLRKSQFSALCNRELSIHILLTPPINSAVPIHCHALYLLQTMHVPPPTCQADYSEA